MRQVVEHAPFPYLLEPGLLSNGGKGEEACGMLVKNATRESCYHTKDGELSEVKESRSRKAASKEVYDTSGSVLEEPEQTAECLLVMLVDHGNFLLTEDKWSKTRHQDRDSIQFVNMEA